MLPGFGLEGVRTGIGAERQKIIAVVAVEKETFPQRVQIVQAGGALGPHSGLMQCRHQQGGQDGDDRNYDQKFDQSEYWSHTGEMLQRTMGVINHFVLLFQL